MRRTGFIAQALRNLDALLVAHGDPAPLLFPITLSSVCILLLSVVCVQYRRLCDALRSVSPVPAGSFSTVPWSRGSSGLLVHDKTTPDL